MRIDLAKIKSVSAQWTNKAVEQMEVAAKRAEPLLEKKLTLRQQIGLLVAIKYLYMFLCVSILKDLWYVGYGSYGIDFCFWKEIIATSAFLLVVVQYFRREIRDVFADSLMYILLILYYIPLNSAFAINNESFLFFLCSNAYFWLLIVAVRWGVDWMRRYPLLQKKCGPGEGSLWADRNVMVCCMVICCLFIGYKLMYNGLSLSVSMESSEVYAERAEYVAFLDDISGTLPSYLLSILRNVVSFAAPFYLMTSLMGKKWKHAALALGCILSQYSVSAGKGTLVFIVIILFLYLCDYLNLQKYFKRIFEVGMLALMCVCVLEHILFGSDRIFTLLIRRMLYYPAWLATMYFEYFVEHGPVLLTQNVFLLQNIFEPAYDTSPLTLISQVYFAGEVPSPNSGLFAEAAMHFSVAGTVVFPVILSVVLGIAVWIFRDYGVIIQLFMAIKLALQLQNVPLTRTDSVLSYFVFAFLLLVLPAGRMKMMKDKLQEILKSVKLRRKNHAR